MRYVYFNNNKRHHVISGTNTKCLWFLWDSLNQSQQPTQTKTTLYEMI